MTPDPPLATLKLLKEFNINFDCSTLETSVSNKRSVQALENLVALGADMELCKQSLLNIAVSRGNVKVIPYLFQKGAEVNAEEIRGA